MGRVRVWKREGMVVWKREGVGGGCKREEVIVWKRGGLENMKRGGVHMEEKMASKVVVDGIASSRDNEVAPGINDNGVFLMGE